MKIRLLFTGSLLVLLFNVFSPGSAIAASHTVNKGESLYQIGQLYNSSVETIKAANNLTNNIIYPGQYLYIPENQNKQNFTYYTILPGDTLYQIGQYFGIQYADIMNANGLNSTDIYPGQNLFIPQNIPAGSPQVSRGGIFSGRVPYTRSDFDLLSRLITAEADSESYSTQVAVGAVVLNRILSGAFPKTISEVIYQVDAGGAYQFEPVLNGWINVNPSPSARKAAQAALNGADPSNGALYFFESWVTNTFLKSRPLSMISDSFTFTY